MWQFFALGSLFASAGESVVDKYALVSDRKIDYVVATFWRLLFFSLLTLAVGVIGWAGPLHLALTPAVVFIAFLSLLNSLCYTYLMWHVEVTEIGVIAYLAPFAFLGIDTTILQTHFSSGEIVGIILLVLGGLGFAIDAKTHHMKKDLSLRVWVMFAFGIFFTGALAYTLKYVNANGINSVSFFVSYGLLASAGLLAITILRGRSRKLFAKPALVYLPRILISKAFDTVSSLFWAQALLLASVSKVSAIGALQPFVLFVLTVFMQKVLKMRVDEKLNRTRMEWKAAAMCFLVVGGMLVT